MEKVSDDISSGEELSETVKGFGFCTASPTKGLKRKVL